MKRVWFAALAAAVAIASAIGISRYRDSAPAGAPAASRAKQGEVFSMLDQRALLADVNFIDGEGRPLRLSGFRGKAILLNLWATWCTPCREEMPTLDRLQAKLGGPRFEVLALSIDAGGVPAVKRFYEEIGIKRLRIYVDSTMQASSDLRAFGLPTTLLIDAQGREIGRKVGPAEWDSPAVVKVIEKYLETPAASARAEAAR
ncbi:MAG: TlpA family protein disulfide reductase [Betaproteobacteria bacterium]|nr:TlpA family protein disulfide reductase [Betaproteobacteria bacterium]